MACVCLCSCLFCFALSLCPQDAECFSDGSICSSSLVIIRVRVIINNHPKPTRSMCKKVFSGAFGATYVGELCYQGGGSTPPLQTPPPPNPPPSSLLNQPWGEPNPQSCCMTPCFVAGLSRECVRDGDVRAELNPKVDQKVAPLLFPIIVNPPPSQPRSRFFLGGLQL